MKFALEGDRSTLSFIAKLAVGCMSFSYFFLYFSSFWGPFWMSWGAFGALLVPRGAQGDSGLHFLAFFSTFGTLWAPRKRQKEAQGAQRRPKRCPKWSRRVPKATSKGYFFESSETLIFNDSTMIFMVFWCPGGSLRGPKSKKKRLKSEMENKNEKISPKASKMTRKSAPGCPKSAKSAKK